MPAACRRLLPVTLLLALCAATACTATEEAAPPQPTASPEDSPSAPEPVPGPAARAVALAALPGVAQAGAVPTSAPEGGLLVASVRPVRDGGPVLLQQHTDEGWETVASGEQDHAGIARFASSSLPETSDDVVLRAASVGADGAVEEASSPLRDTAWDEVFAEDFDGTSLDTSTWGYRSVGVYNAADDGLCATSDPRAVSVADGTLRLHVKRDPARAGQTCRTDHGSFGYYLNGRVDTQTGFGFTYGVAAARVRFQRDRGQHGAFWLQRSSGVAAPGDPALGGAEVDVAEFFGEGAKDGGMGTFAYYLDAGGDLEQIGGVDPRTSEGLAYGDTWWDQFHVFSVEWTRQAYVYRVDGREVFRTTRGISGVEEHLILSLTSKDFELKRLDPTLLPSTMEVDWVRVWQRARS